MAGHWYSKRRHKYNAKRVELDGINFDSKMEGRYYLKLKERVATGEVIVFLRQPKFHLPGGASYSADFLEFHADGTVHFVDVKGRETTEFRKNKRMVENLYHPIEIETVQA